ncbi:MAG: hypothetical protein M3Q66_10665, partial [Chloroflexota bacterium]|nr:hypothetical protein [Chloroflexota bacterium]
MSERWYGPSGEPLWLDPLPTDETWLSRAEIGEPQEAPRAPETAPAPPKPLRLVHDTAAPDPIPPLSLVERVRGLVERLRRGDLSVRAELDALLHHPEDER